MKSLRRDTSACLWARLVDQEAYPLNRPRQGPADHAAALALYEQLPDTGPAFARCRRHNGIGWSVLKLGDGAAALQHARASVREAGDSGSLRLRAMALHLLSATLEGDAAADAGRRAARIARHLEDEALAHRFRRHT